LNKIENHIYSDIKKTTWIIQKYLDKPLLFHGRKFDIRMWILINSLNEVFLYKKGYMRTSSEPYNENSKDLYVHITNNCLQQYSTNYSVYEEGNTIPLDNLQEYLNEKFPNYSINVEKHIIARMKDIIIDTYLSIPNTYKFREKSFELLGYDFLIDDDFRVWFLEVNYQLN